MTLKDFIIKTRWTPDSGLDSRANYSGPDLSEWCQGPGRSRDSEILAESNFETALERLGGEVDGQVEVHRFGHWGCGWFETIMVNPKNLKAISELKSIYEDLESYPVLDEDDYNDRQYEYMSDYADGAKLELAEAIATHFGLMTDAGEIMFQEALVDIAYELNMECQHYFGTDACVNIYRFREPDDRDLKDLRTCLNQCEFFHSMKAGPDSTEQAIKEYLLACMDGV